MKRKMTGKNHITYLLGIMGITVLFAFFSSSSADNLSTTQNDPGINGIYNQSFEGENNFNSESANYFPAQISLQNHSSRNENISALYLESPALEWSTRLAHGLPNEKSDLYSVQQTIDGGFVAAGSAGISIPLDPDTSDFWLIKTDSNGNKIWDKTFGGSGQSHCYSMQQTSDGGFILAGNTNSKGAGSNDFWLVKTDQNGNVLWDKTFGGSSYETCYSVQETDDEGYILAGNRASDLPAEHFWLIKTDSNGNKLWDKDYGGQFKDLCYSVQQTSDGGYILGGYTVQYIDGIGYNHFRIIKTNRYGDVIWNTIVRSGQKIQQICYSVQQTADGGYICAGTDESVQHEYKFVAYKINSAGVGEWLKYFTYSNMGPCYFGRQTSPGGYVLAGGLGFRLTGLNLIGQELWSNTYGYGGVCRSAQRTIDGGYVLVGYNTSGGGVFGGMAELSNVPPTVPSVPSGPTSGKSGTSYSYSTLATDPDGDQVKYTFDWGDGTDSTTTLVDSSISASLSHTWNSAGTYLVRVMATDSYDAASVKSDSLYVIIAANVPPNIPSVPTGTASGTPGASYSYATSAIDPDGDQVKYTFMWGDGTANTETGLVASGTSQSLAHRWNTAGTYHVQAMATDSLGATSGWSSPRIVIINRPPNIPSIPTGPTSGNPGTSYSYNTSATDPDGDQVKYTFNWGDGITSVTNLSSSGTAESASHTWSAAGTYLVTAKATDSNDASSEWSSALSVVITNPNQAPAAPSRPSGSTSGNPGTSYRYSTSATDPDGDQVKYTFDWGDGTNSTTDLFDSGAFVNATHIWNSSGLYQIRTLSTDSKSASSDWSDPLNVTINAPPSTPTEPMGPPSGTAGAFHNYSTSATDPNGDQISYTFDWGDGTNSTTALLDSGSIANASHTWNHAGIYAVKAKAIDSKGLDSEWSNAINVSIANNSCISGTKFNDSNSNATRDPGEAGLSGWIIRLTRPDGTTINATTNATGAYKFENLTSGTYRVSEIRRSNWTQTYPAWLGDHIINVTDGNVTGVDFGNNYLPVPEIPFPPSGPASGIPGAEYSYSTSSTDPSGYQIAYTFDWGDGSNSTTGLFDSGAVVSAAHIWNSSGIYQVRAMATNSKGASSGWSSELEVTIVAGDIPDQIGVFRNGGLYFDANGDRYWTAGDTMGWFGATGDLPVAGDWEGDGRDEIAVFRNGGLYFDANGDGYWTEGDTMGWFGATGDLPAAGDWDGDGKDEIAVFRNGGWYFDANGDRYWTTGDTTGWFGATGDLPAAGDWDGDGKDEIAVFRNGGLYFDADGDGYWSAGDTTGWFGATGDLPAAGDWDGNGKDEIAVFRNGGWYFDADGDRYWSTGDTTGWFGATGDRPVAGRWGSSSSALGMDDDKPQLDLDQKIEPSEKIRQKRAALEELEEESRDQVREIKIPQKARQ